MLSSSIFIDKNGKILEPEAAVSMPAGSVKLAKRSKLIERYTNDYMLSSARLSAACLIILDKKKLFKQASEKDMTNFRSTLREYLSLTEEILDKERETYTYIIRDDSYMVMTMYRVAYLVRKTCRCRTRWYGRIVRVGHFKDYDFGTEGLFDRNVYNGFEHMLLKSYRIDPRNILKMASLRVAICNIPSIISGKTVYMQ